MELLDETTGPFSRCETSAGLLYHFSDGNFVAQLRELTSQSRQQSGEHSRDARMERLTVAVKQHQVTRTLHRCLPS